MVRDKNACYGLINRHKVAEEGISEFNDRLTEITQIETQKGKKKKVENNQKKVPTKSVEYQPEKTIIRITPPLL